MSDLAEATCWVVIPARGGSKGIGRKNLQRVGGIPLIGRAINAAIGAKKVQRVLVSTDDSEIAEVATRFGAGIIERPASLSGDTASSESALLHAVDMMDRNGERLPDLLAMVQCTSPFLLPDDIDGTIAALEAAREAACAISVCVSHGFLWETDGAGLLRARNHDGGERKRRQDLAPEYLETGGVYVMRLAEFRSVGRRFCGPVGFYEVAPERAMEIDDQTELEAARALAPLLDVPGLQGIVSAIVFDFDGVMTDNKVVVQEDGKESVTCDRSDGLGIEMLRRYGVRQLILSRERNPVVSARAKKLGIECLQGITDKAEALRAWSSAAGVALEEIAYLGNDVNDISCLEIVGFPAIVSDAHPDVVGHARIRLGRKGGEGAVREFCDMLCRHLERGNVNERTV